MSWRRIVSTLVILALVYVGAVLVVMRVEDHFIYYPERGGRVSGPGQDVFFQADDGVKLHARWVRDPHATQTLLYFHGNAGNLASRSPLLADLSQLGASLLAVEYRGYGQSQGTPSEAGLYRDARAAYDFLRAKDGATRIVIVGESLGGGPACELASRVPVSGLILLAAFTSVPEMAGLVFPWLPARLVVRTRYDNLEKIAGIAAPKLIVHGRRDDVIPFAMGERLFAAARAPKEQLWLDHASHNDLAYAQGDALFSRMRAFLASLPASGEPTGSPEARRR